MSVRSCFLMISPVFLDELLVAADLLEAEDHQPQGADDHQDRLHKVGPDHRGQAAAWTKHSSELL